MAVEYVALSSTPGEADDPYEPGRRRIWRANLWKLLYLVPHVLTLPRLRPFLILSTFISFVLLAFPALRSNISSRFDPAIPTDNPYFHTGKIWDHNDEVSARLNRCAKLGLLQNTSLPIPKQKSEEEEQYLISEGCGTNETTIIILASLWSAEAYSGTSTAGETIYAQSVISTLNAYNYAYMFSNLGWWNYDMSKTVEIWSRHKDNVRLIMVDPLQADWCWDNEGCIKSLDKNPRGIEAWRMVSFWYWDDPGNPLGPQFTLSPSPLNSNHFLSFSIEPTCRRLPYLPHNQRASRPQAWILSKQIRYFDPNNTFQGYFAFSIPGIAEIQAKLGITIAGGMERDHQDLSDEYDRNGLTNFGQLDKIGFYNHLSRSFVMIGIGKPRISPSPFDALCMGVPFINPILFWDEENPSNRSAWKPQQWWMTDLEPPYVYHVMAHDLEALERTIHTALLHPIQSFIPDYMKFEHVCERMAEVMEGDWRSKAERILGERLDSGEGRLFEL